jgi:hypothetical protein
MIVESAQILTGQQTISPLQYGSPALVACGESLPIEAAAKSNFRSAKNRRVEIAFTSQETNRAVLLMEPIAITPVERPKNVVKGFTMWCEHLSDGKKREVKNGEKLHVVPDIISGDTITCKALGATEPNGIRWTANDREQKTGSGIDFTHKLRGFKTAREQIMPVDGKWAPHFKPHAVGSLGISAGIEALAAKGRLLRAEAKMSTPVFLAFSAFLDMKKDNSSKDAFDCGFNVEAGWDGLKGEVEFTIFDGWITGKEEMVLMEPKTWKPQKPLLLF